MKKLTMLFLLILSFAFISATLPPPKPIYPTVELIMPNGLDTYNGGTETTLMWSYTSGTMTLTSVTIEYSLNNGDTWTISEENIPPSGSPRVWIVPDVDKPTEVALCKIKLHFLAPKNAVNFVEDTSDYNFTIYPKPGVKWWRELN